MTLDSLNFPLKGAEGEALEAAMAIAVDSVDMQTADGKPLKLRGTDIGVSSQKPGTNGTGIDFPICRSGGCCGRGCGLQKRAAAQGRSMGSLMPRGMSIQPGRY